MAFFHDTRTAAPKTVPTHMIFRVGEQRYGIPLDMVSEVVAAGDIARVISADPAVAGQLELRGKALIVTDMGLRLRGEAVSRGARCCVLIVKRAAKRAGCLVDAPQGTMRIPEGEIEVSGCLVEEASGAASVPAEDVSAPENASVSGAAHGHPLYRGKDGNILLPEREQFFPR